MSIFFKDVAKVGSNILYTEMLEAKDIIYFFLQNPIFEVENPNVTNNILLCKDDIQGKNSKNQEIK